MNIVISRVETKNNSYYWVEGVMQAPPTLYCVQDIERRTVTSDVAISTAQDAYEAYYLGENCGLL